MLHNLIPPLQVSKLPYQFRSVSSFEATLRQPVGSTYVPMAVHTELTAPAVRTKAGAIIQPMTEDELLRLPEARHMLKQKQIVNRRKKKPKAGITKQPAKPAAKVDGSKKKKLDNDILPTKRQKLCFIFTRSIDN